MRRECRCRREFHRHGHDACGRGAGLSTVISDDVSRGHERSRTSEDRMGRKAVGESALIRSLCSSSFAAASSTPQRCVSAAGFSMSITDVDLTSA